MSGPATLERPGPWHERTDPSMQARDYPQATHERFWVKVDKDGEGGCWLWTASCYLNGYGQFGADWRVSNKLAHRFAYELLVGPIPEGLHLDHLCRVRRCVNPDHLEPVTHQENVRRGWPATKTHCVHGHAYAEGNLYVAPDGRRQCHRCRRAAGARSRERRAGIWTDDQGMLF